jgi:hypothetical protein
MLPVTVAHHVNILTISFLIVINIQYTREILSNSLNWLPSNNNIDVKVLTKGSDFLTYQENTSILTPKDLQMI